MGEEGIFELFDFTEIFRIGNSLIRFTQGDLKKALRGEANLEAFLGRSLNEFIDHSLDVPVRYCPNPDERASYIANTSPTTQPFRYYRYPVISSVQAGKFAECIVPYPSGMEDQHESTDYNAKGPAFWLEVAGDSMTAPAGVRPSIPEGTLVLVDTGIEATPGKLVVAQLDESNEATFKKYIVESGQKYLKPLNPAYPLIPINGNCRIIGVAVEAKTKL